MRKILTILLFSSILLLNGCALPFEFLINNGENQTRLEIKLNDEINNASTVSNPNFYTIKEIQNMVFNENCYMPSVGSIDVLVIPISFLNKNEFSNSNIEILEKGFFGEDFLTGWESLRSYYLKSSFNKLTIDGTITKPFKTSKTAAYYERNDKPLYYSSSSYKIREIIEEALNYFDDTYDYNNFDKDKDGIIDAIYLVYDTPVDWIEDTIYWAWQDRFIKNKTWDGIKASQFVWIGMDFFAKDNYGIDTDKINSSTLIHETGHLLGLPDYYDSSFNYGSNKGLGEADMMDNNIGDHNAFTKTILGWIEPKVVISDITLNLSSYSDTGDAIIICPNWNSATNILSEFYVLEFFTPTSLNAINYFSLYNGYNVSGIRILHVNARVDVLPYYEYYLFSYDNSYSKYSLLSTFSVGLNDFIESDSYSMDYDLLEEGMTCTITDNEQIIDNSLKNITITFLNNVENVANIEIKFN